MGTELDTELGTELDTELDTELTTEKANNPNHVLKLEGVHAHYGDSHVLHDVSFALEEGKVLALLGRNGAGKTTSISTIIGFVKAAQGTITCFGERIEALPTERISQLGVGLGHKGGACFPICRSAKTSPWPPGIAPNAKTRGHWRGCSICSRA